MDKLNGNDLKKAIRRLGIKWPGDGDYGFGTEVYLGGSNRVVRLVEKLDDLGAYRTEEGGTYTERRVGTVVNQRYDPPTEKTVAVTDRSFNRRLRQMVIDYLVKRKQVPTILHISFDDLMEVMREEPGLAQSGEIGMDIALVPRGQPMSVDRRIA